ncbi:MAG: DUF2845 domain-containing protein [Deltaproteobacteria bacterium]|nr:DUF2845 domain-containing protein [Deltaproteobacteria bacterium]
MIRVLLLLPALLLGSALFDSADAAALFRCGGGIVSKSTSLERVAEICGEPDEASRRTEVRRSGGEWRDGRYWGGSTRVVHVETWVFDLGPRRLVQALTFENGSLVRIESRGYGSSRARDAARWSRRQWTVMPRVAERLRPLSD